MTKEQEQYIVELERILHHIERKEASGELSTRIFVESPHHKWEVIEDLLAYGYEVYENEYGGLDIIWGRKENL